MKNYIIKKLYLLLLLGVVMSSCKEDDSIVQSAPLKDVTITEFLSLNDLREYQAFNNAIKLAFLSNDVVDQLNLGIIATSADVDAVLSNYPAQVSEFVRNNKFGNVPSFSKSFDAGSEGVITENTEFNQVIENYSVSRDSLVKSLNIYLNTIISESKRLQDTDESGSTQDFANLEDIVIPNFDIEPKDIYSAATLLDRKDYEFTLFVTRDVIADGKLVSTFPDFETNKGDPRLDFGEQILENLIPQKLSFEQLNGKSEANVFTSLAGSEITIGNVNNVTGQDDEGNDIVETTEGVINTDQATIDTVYRNIDASGNGFIHQVDKLLVVPSTGADL